MRPSAIGRCAVSCTTLTTRITQLMHQAEQQLRVARNSHHDVMCSFAADVDNLWEQVMTVARSARALKETDTVLALVFRLLHGGLQPSRGKTAAETWPALVRHLAPYSDVEANSVLSYPGITESDESREAAMVNALCRDEQLCSRSSDLYDRPLLRLTRETLLLTGGIVPLSARAPCSDGGAVSRLLDAFCSCCERIFSDCTDAATYDGCFLEMSKAVLDTLQIIEETIDVRTSSPLVLSLLRFMRLLQERDKGRGNQSGDCAENSEIFAEGLISALPKNGVGARIVLFFVYKQCELSPEELVHLPLVCVAARGIWRNYKKLDTVFPCLEHLKRVNEALDVTLQRNANNHNPLGLRENDEGELRLLVALALLRGMRLHADSPDIFLQNAIEVVDGCPPSLSLEYEVLVAKASLLDLYVDDEVSSNAIYDDLLHSLRALVELRPRDAESDALTADNDEKDPSGSSDKLTRRQQQQLKHAEEEKQLLRQQLQEAHRIVVDAFARSRIQERLDQAYTILVAHKYHGLSITQEVAYPLLDVLSRRGDCRVFNIVDLCVLYSGCNIDYDALICLFRACRVAGDFYRARTLYQLLKETIPGFLLRAPSSIREMLRQLKVLEPEPTHLFADCPLLNEFATGSNCANDLLPNQLVDEDDLSNRQRGPLRELPSSKTE